MNDVIDKLQIEYKDLNDRIERLKKFLSDPENDKKVGVEQWNLLHKQLSAMTQYSSILNLRIYNLTIQ